MLDTGDPYYYEYVGTTGEESSHYKELFLCLGETHGSVQVLLFILCSGITPEEIGETYEMLGLKSRCKSTSLPTILLLLSSLGNLKS